MVGILPILGGGAALATAVRLLAPDAAEAEPVTVPLPDVTPDTWVTFVRGFVGPNEVDPRHRIGVFGLTVRRLCDLGVMTRPKSIRARKQGGPLDGPSIVWTGTWVAPHSLKAFLADPMGQYGFFADSVKRYAADESLRKAVGAEIDGTRATVSGLLAVAHRGGTVGLGKWLTSAKERAHFDHTTAAYTRLNGLF